MVSTRSSSLKTRPHAAQSRLPAYRKAPWWKSNASRCSMQVAATSDQLVIRITNFPLKSRSHASRIPDQLLAVDLFHCPGILEYYRATYRRSSNPQRYSSRTLSIWRVGVGAILHREFPEAGSVLQPGTIRT